MIHDVTIICSPVTLHRQRKFFFSLSPQLSLSHALPINRINGGKRERVIIKTRLCAALEPGDWGGKDAGKMIFT